MYRIKLLDSAYSDLKKSSNWYDLQKDGLGKLFLKQFFRTLKHIEQNPYLYAVKFFEEFRFAKLNKFPFFIVFEIIEDVVAVNAVFHTSRSPKEF